MRSCVNMFWHGGELPPLMWACMRSFVEHGHCLRVFTYADLAVPDTVVLADANDVLAIDGDLEDYQAIGAFSDVFRYKLLYQYGGWWMDTDVYCLTPTLPARPYAWAEQEAGIVNGAILKFPKGDPLCGRLLELALVRKGNSQEWGTIGPMLMSEVVGGCERLDRAGSAETFYPLHWLEAYFLWLAEAKAEVARRLQGALFLHCWARALAAMGIDIRQDPPAGSFLAEVIARCPNRSQPKFEHHAKTKRAIRRYLRQDGVRDRWRTTLGRDPGYLDAIRRKGLLGFVLRRGNCSA